jgi:hypothetical protein
VLCVQHVASIYREEEKRGHLDKNKKGAIIIPMVLQTAAALAALYFAVAGRNDCTCF